MLSWYISVLIISVLLFHCNILLDW